MNVILTVKEKKKMNLEWLTIGNIKSGMKSVPI